MAMDQSTTCRQGRDYADWVNIAVDVRACSNAHLISLFGSRGKKFKGVYAPDLSNQVIFVSINLGFE
ncbi:hypothetical protein ACTXT7_012735 [Hymenolepis weldensis]